LAAFRRWLRTVFGAETPRKTRVRALWRGIAAVFAALLVGLVVYALLLIPFTPGLGTLRKSRVEVPSVVVAAGGEILTHYQLVQREWVPLEDISEAVVQALIATEDHRFFDHPGVDPIRTAGALVETLRGNRQGGSTITQQLARNMFPEEIGRSISIHRKLKELITALKIEIAFTKDEILEAYLNTVPFYFGAYGIEMAARTYFDTSAGELDVLEAATLVGMLKGTYYYNPVRNPDRALARRNVALAQMVKRSFLDEAEYVAMKEGPIRLQFERQEDEGSAAPHFTEHLRMWLIDWADRNDYNIYRDSLVIHTTLDLELQQMAEEAVRRQGDALQAVADVEWGRADGSLVARTAAAYQGFRRSVQPFEHFWTARPGVVRAFVRGTQAFRTGREAGIDEVTLLDSLLAQPAFMDSLRREKTRLQVGFVAIEPQTGFVKAWVGSRSFDDDAYDHVARARRQPGSTFKPFVYARALEEGYRPDDTIVDREVEIPLGGGEIWRPANAGETVSGSDVTLIDGLVYSKNTITAQLVEDVGAGDVARLARRMGVNRSELRAVPSIALGTSEVSLLEMVSAYGTFASEGLYHEPLMVLRIEDRTGRVLEEFAPSSRRAISDEVARTVLDMMRSVVDRGTATRVRTSFGIDGDVAGKTGTTQYGADGWFILMHPELVAGSWVGFNDPRITFRSDYWGQGGNNALLVTGDFFRQVLLGEALDRGAAFSPPPQLAEGQPLLARLFGWIRDRAAAAWSALFGGEDEEESVRQGDTYIADRTSGAVQIDFDERSEAFADSLIRMERRRNRLDSLIQLLPGGRPDAEAEARTAGPEDERGGLDVEGGGAANDGGDVPTIDAVPGEADESNVLVP
jgi:penicillin-binding protein 1A